MGLVVQRCCETTAAQQWRLVWPRFLAILAALMLLAGIFVIVTTTLDNGSWIIGQPVWFAVVYVLCVAVLAATAWRLREATAYPWSGVALLSVAVFLVLTLAGVRDNILIHTSEPTAEAVADLKRHLPPDTRLVSLGPVFHVFVYYYGDPIPILPRSGRESALPACGAYFCFDESASPPVKVNFPWEPIAKISCERRHRPHPHDVVVVGRRLP